MPAAYADNLTAPLAPPSRDDLFGSTAPRLKNMYWHDKGHLAHPYLHASIDDRIFGDDITERGGCFEHETTPTGCAKQPAKGAQQSSLGNALTPASLNNICWASSHWGTA